MTADTQDAPARGIWTIWPLRLIVLVVVLVVLYGGAQALPLILLKLGLQPPADPVRLATGALAALAALCGYLLLVRWMEKRRITELGGSGASMGLIAGIVLGFGLFTAVFAVLSALGVARIDGVAGTDGLGLALAIALASAVGEEIIFRGVIFRIVEDGCGTLVALIVSAALFGLIHLANAGATLTSAAAIMLEAGVLLGAAYEIGRAHV